MLKRDSITAAVAGPLAVGLVTFGLRLPADLPSPATAALLFLLVVVLTAAAATRVAAFATSIVAFLCFNYFFLPPLGTWTIADPQNWVALFTLLGVSVVVSHLAGIARSQTMAAEERRAETARLFDFSRDVLLTTDERGSLNALARSLIARYHFSAVEIAVRGQTTWQHFAAGQPLAVSDSERDMVVAGGDRTLEFDARARAYRGQRRVTVDGVVVNLVPIRRGTTVTGVLLVAGGPADTGSLDTLAGLVAIAIERTIQSDARRESEVAKASDALKTTLLSALAHDLRTPLTAVRVAAANLQEDRLTPSERQEQGELIRDEVDRLTRLFDNVLQMARIDAGGMSLAVQRVHPSEVMEAARVLTSLTLAGREVRAEVVDDEPFPVDQRLVAMALAHLLDNAAKYSPASTPIELTARRSAAAVRFEVRDFGPGVPEADAERIFEPFYRVSSTGLGAPGTGLGLAIVRGLLAAVGGRVWMESPTDGGSRFIIEVSSQS